VVAFHTLVAFMHLAFLSKARYVAYKCSVQLYIYGLASRLPCPGFSPENFGQGSITQGVFDQRVIFQYGGSLFLPRLLGVIS
jgi:hypothetical protein